MQSLIKVEINLKTVKYRVKTDDNRVGQRALRGELSGNDRELRNTNVNKLRLHRKHR